MPNQIRFWLGEFWPKLQQISCVLSDRLSAISETRLFGIGGAIVASPSVRHFPNYVYAVNSERKCFSRGPLNGQSWNSPTIPRQKPLQRTLAYGARDRKRCCGAVPDGAKRRASCNADQS
jgi:hypothetical protein